MDLLLGLPSLAVLDVSETFEGTTCSLEVTGNPPSCPDCQPGTDRIRVHGAVTSKVWDTPSRGKRMRLVIKRPRFRCRCGATFCLHGSSGIDANYPSMTSRLVRYIENAAFRRTIADISRETGVSGTNARAIAERMAKRLYDHHRFPTPEILGIDDLRIKKKLYTVITDGRTGYAIGLVEGGKELTIRQELYRREVLPDQVKIVVSDLGGSNIAVVKKLFPHVIHVADKWHVLKGAKEALYLVINKEIDRLRRRRALWTKRLAAKGIKVGKGSVKGTRPHPLIRMQHRIDTLKDAKKHLAGARILLRDDAQPVLDINTMIIKPLLSRYPKIGRAFWARMRLHMVYAQSSRADADRQIDRFIARATSKSIRAQMKVITERVVAHRDLILNYYDALEPDASGKLRAPTTGPTERRNGTIKAAWRSARGITNHEMFAMKAIYQPWLLDVDIGVCSHQGCLKVQGPLPERDGRLKLVVTSGYGHLCGDNHEAA